MSKELKLSPEQVKQLKGEPYRRSLKAFIKHFWGVVQPQRPFVDAYYTDAIADHLTHINDIKKLMICLPPRMGKSTILNLWFTWLWASCPESRFITACHGMGLSERNNLACRKVLQSPVYQSYYGHIVKMSEDQNTKVRFTNTKGGYRLATAVESGITGEGGDYNVVDDPHDIQKIESKAEREQTVNWYSTVFTNRIENYNTGCRLLVGQRCHADDLFGSIIKNDKENDWCKLILPCEYNPKKVIVTKLGWQDPRTEEGDLLCPEVIPASEMKYARVTAGRRAVNAQYNQDPSPKEDALFDIDDIQRYSWYDAKTCVRLASVDLAFSNDGDYTVIIVADVAPTGDVYVVHMHRARMPSPKIIPTLEAIQEKYNPALVYIEDVGTQKMIINEARMKRIPTKGVQPHNAGKIARSVLLQCKAEGHQLHIPKDAPWASELLEELQDFPNGSHDDICFVAGTMIQTPEGQKRIEDIRPGELVTTRYGVFPVVAASSTGVHSVYQLRCKDGTELTGTGNHPIMTTNGWLPLHSLTKRSRVVSQNGLVAKNVQQLYQVGREEVYNLTVAGAHEYIANGIVVHNCDALSYLVNECWRFVKRGEQQQEEATEQTEDEIKEVERKRYTDRVLEGLRL